MVKKEPSFRDLIDGGKSKKETMEIKHMTSEEYDKALDSFLKIRAIQKKTAEDHSVTVRFDDRPGMYRIDLAQRLYINTENPEDRIPFDSDEPIVVKAFTCPNCKSLISQLDYKEQGTYRLNRYVSEKTEFFCPLCHVEFDKETLHAMGM